MAVVPDDAHGQRFSDEEERQPSRSQTPPTPPVQDEPSPPMRPMRQSAIAQLRPVSISNIVCDIAGADPLRKIADFDRHYMQDGQPADETSSRGISGAHRAELKRIIHIISIIAIMCIIASNMLYVNYVYYSYYCNYCLLLCCRMVGVCWISGGIRA